MEHAGFIFRVDGGSTVSIHFAFIVINLRNLERNTDSSIAVTDPT
jgi:hypothetical protein